MTDTTPKFQSAKEFKRGYYRHFKGGVYKIICVARDSEDRQKELIVYQSRDTGDIWVRPLSMFLEHVEREGYSGPRFQYLGKHV